MIKSKFLLDPTITFLNFGSFGACPKEVFEVYQQYQYELEREPVQFIAVNGPEYLKRSRGKLAEYIGCKSADIVYVTNPSYAVNIVAKSLNLQPGDEILTTDLEYGACEKTWTWFSNKNKVKLVKQVVPLPLISKEKFVDAFFEGVSPKTRLIFISHITSTTALILPVREICERARSLGIITYVDGAHAPGHVPLNLRELNADFYTGACHKWMMTAKGCSFFYVKKDLQLTIDPLVVSWGYDPASTSASRFVDFHEGQGTRDFSAFLTVPAAIDFMNKNNWVQVSAECRVLVKKNVARFCELLKTSPLATVSDEFFGQMASFQIQTSSPQKLQKLLFDQYRIEVPVMTLDNRTFIRYSINGFNSQQDLDALYDALSEIINKTDLISV